MKKKMLSVIFAVLLFAMLSVTAFALDLGDVNCDEKISAADARIALRYAAKLEELTEEQLAAADVDASGKVTSSDARKILRVASKIDDFSNNDSIASMLVEDGVLHVAVCADNPPFCYIKNGEITGADVDAAKKIAALYGLELKLHDMDYDSLVDSVKNNECDIALVKTASGKTFSDTYSVKYNNNTKYIYYLADKAFNSTEQLKSQKLGVINGSVADIMLTNDVKNGELGDAQIVRYSRYADAVKDLKSKDIYAFIGDADFRFGNGIDRYSGYYAKEDYLLVSSSEKSALADKLCGVINTAIVQGFVEKYCPAIVSNSSIICNASNITLAPGSTAMIEVIDNSFYGNDSLKVKSSPYNTELVNGADKYYLVIRVPADAKSGKIVLTLSNETAVTADINVTISKSTGIKYNFGNTSYFPDLGAFTGVAPMDVLVDMENGAISYIYNSEELYNHGITDVEMLDDYFKFVENQGFEADSYQTDDSTYYILYYYNKSLDKVAAYAEYYSYQGDYAYVDGFSITVQYQF